MGSVQALEPITCSKKKDTPKAVCLFFLEGGLITDESRGGSRLREQTLCLTGLGFRWIVRQRRQLIIAERGAPPKARLSSFLSIAKARAYHQPYLGWILFRNDDIQHCALVICNFLRN